jgi:D-serine deaminase-like pyridoxal phosphate-dependent protein
VTTDNLLPPDDGGATGPPITFGVPRGEALIESARLGSGITTVYEALDRLVDLYALDDAALVVDVPGFGRQVLHAGRKPLGNDERGLLRAPPGLYLEPPLADPALDDLMVTVGALGLRLDLTARSSESGNT